MSTTGHRPEKRLVACEHPSTELCQCRLDAVAMVLTRYPPAELTDLIARQDRERVALAEIRTPLVRPARREPLEITHDDERHGDSLLGAAGAWACVAISVLLLLTLAARQLWLWWT